VYCFRPIVGVYNSSSPNKPEEEGVVMPLVMESAIRCDLVAFVYMNIARNHRQAYGVLEGAGYQSSAESWGTGRAVSRIPRVAGGGTHTAGQAAFGNMCRGGGMFAPNKVWRRWHRSVNLTQRRHAVASAIAASAFSGLVLGHGHRINNIPELPLVVSDDVQKYKKTSEAVSFLKNIGCEDELQRVISSKKIRCGKGKYRNRRYTMRKGPLVVYREDNGIVRAFSNIPGVDTCHVDRLNLLQLAPGGAVGRFVIWTRSAFSRLSDLYNENQVTLKANYTLHRPVMTNPDLARIINSNEVQSQLNLPKPKALIAKRNKNALRNRLVRCRLDPAYKALKAHRRLASTVGTTLRERVKSRQIAKKAETRLYRKKVAPFVKRLRLLDVENA
jgi:large subunit ribosomal protein L4e